MVRIKPASQQYVFSNSRDRAKGKAISIPAGTKAER